ncbi:ferredoxin [Streptomyces sp. NPDC049813]|uniref:ferredoxin n=1 Tax=Streptomyces sp. NPDC049813 TaxID=3365597 RepID=UPI003794C96F
MTPLANHPHRGAETTEAASAAEPPKAALVRFLEARFACAQACTESARAAAVRVSALEPAPGIPPVHGPVRPMSAWDAEGQGQRHGLRRALLLCVEVCDATARLLSGEGHQDEYGLRLQVEWCRAVVLECAHACDGLPDAADCAEQCRGCARACTDFLAILD